MNQKQITIKEIILTVILAIAFGIIYRVLGPVYDFAGSITPFLSEFVYPVWFIAGIITGYIIRKPGVAFFAELLASSGELLTGGQYGLSTLASGALQGLGAEAVFLVFGYRRWSISVLMLASMLATLGSFVIDYAVYGYGTKTIFIQVTSVISRFVGSLFVCGLLGKWISDALVQTGVLNSYRIVRARQIAKWEEK